ncbi:MAG TPA: hypothetical protein VND93_19565 [Myxococcales bacterium]|nr:hypothetical protein [Myxococcales bacterium]
MGISRSGLWGWVDAGDEARLREAHAALCARALPEPVGSWLRAPATAARLAAPPLGPPLARWALRAGDAAGLASAAVAALVVAVLAEEGGEAPGALARWGAAPALCEGASGRDPSRWLLERAGEAACDVRLDLALGLPALLAGRDPAAWLSLGRAAAPLASLLASWERLWLDPAARDVEDAGRAARSSWVAAGLASPSGFDVALAYAGDRRSARRHEEVRDALSAPAVLKALRARGDEALARARACVVDETCAAGAALLDALEGGLRWIESFLWARSAVRPAAAVPAWSWASLEVDVQRALERIDFDPRWTGSMDRQRWGIEDMKGDLAATWFPRGFIELGLHAVTGGREARLRALLMEAPPGDLRYFPGFRGIPPDADSLGLALQMAAALPDPPADRIERWLALMAYNLDGGGAPRVWFRRSSAGPTHDPPEVVWAGDDCTACRLSLALGLLQYDPARFDREITAILGAALARFRGDGFDGTHHYAPEFADTLFLRIAARLAESGAAAPLHAEVARRRDALVGAILGSQRLDGSWGGLHATAWYLEALCLHRPERAAVLRAARFLSEMQRGDGGFLPELLYWIVGKPGLMVEYRGLELTTSICARALDAARRAAAAAGWA